MKKSEMTHALGFAVLQEESRVVIIRFGHDWDQVCMQMDEVLLIVTLWPFVFPRGPASDFLRSCSPLKTL